MKKPLLFIAALTVAFTSCQKTTSGNGPWTCTCDYAFHRPYPSGGYFYVRDTTVAVTYARGTSITDAQLYCTNNQSNLKADTTKQNVNCFVHE